MTDKEQEISNDFIAQGLIEGMDSFNRLQLVFAIWHKAQTEWSRLSPKEKRDVVTAKSAFQWSMYRVCLESRQWADTIESR